MSDMSDALKVVDCLFSQFKELQERNGETWDTANGGAPYYVCAAFSNSRHIPLSLVLSPASAYGPLQRLALRIAEWLAFYTPFASNYRAAFVACAEYDHEWQDAE